MIHIRHLEKALHIASAQQLTVLIQLSSLGLILLCLILLCLILSCLILFVLSLNKLYFHQLSDHQSTSQHPLVGMGFPGHVARAPLLLKTSLLVKFCNLHLTVLRRFEEETPAISFFHFALGPACYVTGLPWSCDATGLLTSCMSRVRQGHPPWSLHLLPP
jgi:hypothetical protein